MAINLLPGVPLPNGDVMYYGRALMLVPAGGASVRQYPFEFPAVEIATDPVTGFSTPTVLATVHPAGSGSLDVMPMLQIDIAPSYPDTIVKVTIGNPAGSAAILGDYDCNIIVIGTPLGRPKPRPARPAKKAAGKAAVKAAAKTAAKKAAKTR